MSVHRGSSSDSSSINDGRSSAERTREAEGDGGSEDGARGRWPTSVKGLRQLVQLDDAKWSRSVEKLVDVTTKVGY